MNPESLQYAKTHEWVSVSEEAGQQVATVGISAFAVEALTDLVFMELPKVDQQVIAGQSMAEIESVKAVSDIYAPVTGKVIAVNESLPNNLEVLNEDPYEKGWIAKIAMDSAGELMSHAEYHQLCEEES